MTFDPSWGEQAFDQGPKMQASAAAMAAKAEPSRPLPTIGPFVQSLIVCGNGNYRPGFVSIYRGEDRIGFCGVDQRAGAVDATGTLRGEMWGEGCRIVAQDAFVRLALTNGETIKAS